MKNKDIISTGGRSVAVGIDAKIIPTGICGNPDIIPEEEKRNDPNNPINKCIFNKRNNLCYFSGDCDRKVSLDSSK